MTPETSLSHDPAGAVGISVNEMLQRARERIVRIGPEDLEVFKVQGGLVVDIRPPGQREAEGELPGAIVVERNVLEWRLEPWGEHALDQVDGCSTPVVIVCSEGYASSLAASALVDLGYQFAGDLIGGFKAWANFVASNRAQDTSVH
jgi:rhodanese-related sulfurtransferase